MNATEVYNMVVRLGGDASGLHSALGQVRGSLSSTATYAQEAGRRIEGAAKPPPGIFAQAWAYLTGTYKDVASAAGGVESAQRRVGGAFADTQASLEDWTEWDLGETVKGFNFTINEFKSSWGLLQTLLTGGIAGIFSVFVANWSSIVAKAGEWWDDVDEGAAEVIDGVREKLQKLFDWFSNIGTMAIKGLGTVLEGISHVFWDIVESTKAVWEEIEPWAKELGHVALIVGTIIVQGFVTLLFLAGKVYDLFGGFSGVWKSITDAISAAWEAATEFFSELITGWADFASNDLINNLFSIAAGIGFVAVIAAKAAAGIYDLSSTLFDLASAGVSRVTEGFQSLFGAASQLSEVFFDLLYYLRGLTVLLTVVTAGTVALYTAYRVLYTVLGLLHIRQLAMYALQVAWNVALLVWRGIVLVATAAMLAYNVTLSVGEFLMGVVGTAAQALSAIGMGAITVGALVAKGAIWLLNTALLALYSLVVPGTLLALAAGFIVVATAATLIGSALYGVLSAAGAVFDVMNKISMEAGPVQAIGNLFGEWFQNIQLIVRALKTDFGLAWEILIISAQLAVSRLKDLWPPLWTFIKGGFEALWELVTTVFVLKFRQGLATSLRFFGSDFAERIVNFFGNIPGLGDYANNLRQNLQGVRDAADEIGASVDDAVGRANERFDALITTFNKGFRDSGMTQALHRELQNLRRDLETAEFDKWINDALGSEWELTKATDQVGESFARAYRELHRFDAAASGSAEAIGRLTNFQLGLLDQSRAVQARNAGTAAAAATSPYIPWTAELVRRYLSGPSPYGSSGVGPLAVVPTGISPEIVASLTGALGAGGGPLGSGLSALANLRLPAREGGGIQPGAFGTPEFNPPGAGEGVSERPTEVINVLTQIRDAFTRGLFGQNDAATRVGEAMARGFLSGMRDRLDNPANIAAEVIGGGAGGAGGPQ